MKKARSAALWALELIRALLMTGGLDQLQVRAADILAISSVPITCLGTHVCALRTMTTVSGTLSQCYLVHGCHSGDVVLNSKLT